MKLLKGEYDVTIVRETLKKFNIVGKFSVDEYGTNDWAKYTQHTIAKTGETFRVGGDGSSEVGTYADYNDILPNADIVTKSCISYIGKPAWGYSMAGDFEAISPRGVRFLRFLKRDFLGKQKKQESPRIKAEALKNAKTFGGGIFKR
jgi:hypothetical protein